MSFDDDRFKHPSLIHQQHYHLHHLQQRPTNSIHTGLEKDDDGTTATVSTSNSADSLSGSNSHRPRRSSRSNTISNSKNKNKMGLDEANLSRTLDEAFGSGPPVRTKSGSRRRDEKSVGSSGSREASGERGGAPKRGLARQRSQRRADIAAAVFQVAADGTGVEDHVASARQQRRIPRRAKTHEDRLQAASMDSIAGGVINLGFATTAAMDGSHESQDRISKNSRNHRQDLGYGYDSEEDDEDEEERLEREQIQKEIERDRGNRPRRSRRPGGEESSEPRRGGGRMPSRHASKSFDDSMANMRARGRRRASMVGSTGAAGGTDDESSGMRPRRVRRASMVTGDEAGNLTARPEPPLRSANRSASGRARRAQSMVENNPSSFTNRGGPGLRRAGTGEGNSPSRARDRERAAADLGYGAAEPDADSADEEELQKQEWAEKRADKQKAMLAKLRGGGAKAEEDEGSLGEEGMGESVEDVPPPEPEPPKRDEKRKGGRRMSMAGAIKKFGMSSTNFSSFDPEEGESKGDKKKEHRRHKHHDSRGGKPEARKTMPLRQKSADGMVEKGASGRARASDPARRRRGTMLDRIGA